MRVLIVHNRYRSSMPSGENLVVDDDVRMLRDGGIEVETFFRESDAIAGFGALRKATLAVSPTYSLEATRDLRRVLQRFSPDVVHLHNPVPLISPWVIRVAKQAGLPVVQTVHNYRHSCPGSTSFFRDGKICESCVGKPFPWPGVVHGCYRNSRGQSLSMAVAARVHRPTWQLVDKFLAVSGYVAHHLALTGIPRSQIVVHPNATRSWGESRPPGHGYVFVGRLTPEKGVSLLMEAWARGGAFAAHPLVVAGDGPERDAVVGARERNVRYEGAVDASRVRQLLDEAAVVVIPSLSYEGFPRLVAEAFERGRPVASTALGSLADLVTPEVGWTAEADPGAFAAMLSTAASDPQLSTKAAAARAVYEADLTLDHRLRRLLDVYGEVARTTGRRVPAARGQGVT